MKLSLHKKLKSCLIIVTALTSLWAQATESVEFVVRLSPVGEFVAKSPALKGSAVKKGEGYIAKNVTLDLRSLKTGMELRDRHMGEYFETDKFPMAEVTAAQGKNGKFAAHLVIRKQKQKIVGTYDVSSNVLTAKFKTTLSAFKIKKANYMGVGVEDEIEVQIRIPVK